MTEADYRRACDLAERAIDELSSPQPDLLTVLACARELAQLCEREVSGGPKGATS